MQHNDNNSSSSSHNYLNAWPRELPVRRGLSHAFALSAWREVGWSATRTAAQLVRLGVGSAVLLRLADLLQHCCSSKRRKSSRGIEHERVGAEGTGEQERAVCVRANCLD